MGGETPVPFFLLKIKNSLKMVKFEFPKDSRPADEKNWYDLGISQERRDKILQEMHRVAEEAQDEYTPKDSIQNWDLMERFMRKIPLETPNEVFLLGYFCGKMFAETSNPLISLLANMI